MLRRARTESDLLEAFDWPVERIRRRCEALRRRPPLRLGQPPPWSAWSAFSVRRRDRPSPRVEVVARQGGSLRFEIAAAPDVAFTGRLVQRDLGVLRPEEFVLKYRSCRVAPAAECGLPWEELF
ncbi:MAG: hypothetical protein FJX77_11945 [Armatimonadetes bacterium]|nr:hypothetical protein [Armatimonadota bacterium]